MWTPDTVEEEFSHDERTIDIMFEAAGWISTPPFSLSLLCLSQCGFYWQLRLSRSVEITEWKRPKEEKSEGLLIQVHFLTTGVMGRLVGSMMVGQVVLPLLLFITVISALSPPQPRVFLPFQVERA
ncbi:hypothetical protein SRHO_G00005530 [Serrasalmus rhombeus]